MNDYNLLIYYAELFSKESTKKWIIKKYNWSSSRKETHGYKSCPYQKNKRTQQDYQLKTIYRIIRKGMIDSANVKVKCTEKTLRLTVWELQRIYGSEMRKLLRRSSLSLDVFSRFVSTIACASKLQFIHCLSFSSLQIVNLNKLTRKCNKR